jgi:hypothetical protein
MADKGDSANSKVVLAADAGSYSLASVNLAVAMAASAHSLLQGSFVEDEDLLQLTGLPCAREITLTTGTQRNTSIEQLQRSLRLVASEFRQALQQEAQALQVPWRFDTVRGRVRDFGLKPTGGATYTILAHASTHRLHYTQLRAARRILLLARRPQQQMRALEMLLARSPRERIELTLVTCDGRHADRREMLHWLQRYTGRVTLVDISASELLARLGQPGPGYDCALLSHDYSGEDRLLLLKSLNCPIILSA